MARKIARKSRTRGDDQRARPSHADGTYAAVTAAAAASATTTTADATDAADADRSALPQEKIVQLRMLGSPSVIGPVQPLPVHDHQSGLVLPLAKIERPTMVIFEAASGDSLPLMTDFICLPSR